MIEGAFYVLLALGAIVVLAIGALIAVFWAINRSERLFPSE